LNRNESERFGAVKSDSIHHFFRNSCTKSGPLRFPSFPVVDWFCLFVDLWVLIFPLGDCSVFGNFVITLMLRQVLTFVTKLGHQNICLKMVLG